MERVKAKVDGFKEGKAAELEVQRAQLRARRDELRAKRGEKRKKTPSLEELNKLYRMHIHWTIILSIAGMAMFLVGVCFMGVFETPIPKDVGSGLTWWVVGLLLLGIGIGEGTSISGIRKAIYMRQNGTLDENIQGSEHKNNPENDEKEES